jgi:predicted PurR-regulated permease PerM
LLPPGLYFSVHLVEGETLTSTLPRGRFTLNPVLVILSLVLWFWMWGVPGAILAVPMLAIMKLSAIGCVSSKRSDISSKDKQRLPSRCVVALVLRSAGDGIALCRGST